MKEVLATTNPEHKRNDANKNTFNNLKSEKRPAMNFVRSAHKPADATIIAMKQTLVKLQHNDKKSVKHKHTCKIYRIYKI